MYNAKLKSGSGSYTLGWKDKNYSFKGNTELIVTEEVRDHLEKNAVDLKGICLFSFTRVKEEAIVTPEITEEVSDLGDVFNDDVPKSGKKSIKKIDGK